MTTFRNVFYVPIRVITYLVNGTTALTAQAAVNTVPLPELVYLMSRWLTCRHNTYSNQPDSTTRAIW
jgi:hypothetical protein